MATLLLEVVTPDKTVLKEDVEMAICPGSEGEFGVLPNHASLLSSLRMGPLRYRKGDRDDVLFISGGFLDMHANVCSVLAESAEKADDIDKARAQAAKERAERRLAEKKEDLDEARATLALQRAILRLQLSK